MPGPKLGIQRTGGPMLNMPIGHPVPRVILLELVVAIRHWTYWWLFNPPPGEWPQVKNWHCPLGGKTDTYSGSLRGYVLGGLWGAWIRWGPPSFKKTWNWDEYIETEVNELKSPRQRRKENRAFYKANGTWKEVCRATNRRWWQSL